MRITVLSRSQALAIGADAAEEELATPDRTHIAAQIAMRVHNGNAQQPPGKTPFGRAVLAAYDAIRDAEQDARIVGL